MVLALVAALLLFVQSPTAPKSAPQSGTNVRARLDAYEKQAQQTGRPDPIALGEIGRLALEQARRSQTFRVWSEACGSTAAPESEDCGQRQRGH
jgi:hypothetical protein